MYRAASIIGEERRRSSLVCTKTRRETMSYHPSGLLRLPQHEEEEEEEEESNLRRFLQCVTPTVPPSLHLPQVQKGINEQNNNAQQGMGGHNDDVVESFRLEELWKCYEEWSAYGAGTKVEVNNTGEEVIQYYVPFLSAIQIYTHKSIVASRCSYGEGAEIESDWSSDDSDNLSRSLSNNSTKTWESSISSEDSSGFEHDTCLGSGRDRLGFLYMQYFEPGSPYCRVPLLNKANELAKNYPGLMTLRNVDLLPASWMAVAWYPIYHIPSWRNEKDLEASFLTYHTLSSSFQDCGNEYEDIVGSYAARPKGTDSVGISLPPFGLATYKMQRDLWLNPATDDHKRLIDLQSAADSWLKQLSVQHHDYNFFVHHIPM